MVLQKALALTTSTALTLGGFAGILCGQGHVFTPLWLASSSRTACLETANLGGLRGLSDKELRSAILLAILTLVIFRSYPPCGRSMGTDRTAIKLGQRNHYRGNWDR